MELGNWTKSVKPGTAAGVVCMVAAWMVAATAGVAQSTDDQRTGVSHPDAAAVTLEPDTESSPPSAPAKPSAAIPARDSSQVVYGPYVPYKAPGTPKQSAAPAKTFDPDANIVTEATAGADDRRLLAGSDSAAGKSDTDAGVVTYVRSGPGEIPEGALLKVRLREDLSTLTTKPGTKFSADVTEPMMRDGRVIVPVGSLLEGRVTWVRGGKRIGGPAAIHLEPRTVTLPDGMQYVLWAQAIDTDRWDSMKVDEEGTILRRDRSKKTAAAIGLSAGGGMAAGAMMGGLPGALIGAGVGAGVSTAMWLKEDRQAELHKNLGVVFSLTEPMSVTSARAMVAPGKAGGSGSE